MWVHKEWTGKVWDHSPLLFAFAGDPLLLRNNEPRRLLFPWIERDYCFESRVWKKEIKNHAWTLKCLLSSLIKVFSHLSMREKTSWCEKINAQVVRNLCAIHAHFEHSILIIQKSLLKGKSRHHKYSTETILCASHAQTMRNFRANHAPAHYI